MKIGVCSQALYNLSYADAIATAARLGAEAIELPVDASSPSVDLDKALTGDWRRLRDKAGEAGLEISCLSNHQEGQLLLGPAADLQDVFAGPAAAQSAWASEQMAKTGDLYSTGFPMSVYGSRTSVTPSSLPSISKRPCSRSSWLTITRPSASTSTRAISCLPAWSR